MSESSRRIFLSAPDLGPEEAAVASARISAGEIGAIGADVGRFEGDLGTYGGFAAVAALNSGSAALHLGLKLLGVGPGDAVICPDFTFVGGVNAIVHLGARPIFADVEPGGFGLDPALTDDAFTLARREGLKVAAIVPADLYGRACDLDGVLAAARGVPVITDTAEGLGARRNGRHAGKGATATVLSFNANKIITTAGGGALASDDTDLIERARRLGLQSKLPGPGYEHDQAGFNYRMSNLSAAIGRVQLESLEEKIARRRAIAALYCSADLPGVAFDPEPEGERWTGWLSVARLDLMAFPGGPDAVIAALAEQNIEARPVWSPMRRQAAFEPALSIGGERADRLRATCLCLPSGSGLSDDEIGRVCEAMKALAR